MSNKRIKSMREYIDELSNQYSKLNIIRIDLAYKKPYSDDITLEEANRDLKHMFNNMRSKPNIFIHKVGYVTKREYTEDRGIHYHMMFIFNGQKVKNAIYKAKQIGEYWKQITENKGSYHNCNSNTYERNGIGLLEHSDREKRKILNEDVLPYLCKDEQGIEPITKNKKDRVFTRGTLHKGKGNMGRPRKE